MGLIMGNGLIFVIMINVAAVLVACGAQPSFNETRYRDAVKSGLALIEAAKEMDDIFEEIDHFISYSPGAKSETNWYSEAWFGGRFVLTLRQRIMVSSDFSRVDRLVGEPEFFLLEVRGVELVTGSRFAATYAQNTVNKITIEEWRLFYENRDAMKIERVGFVEKDPIQYWHEFIQNRRAGRMQLARAESNIEPIKSKISINSFRSRVLPEVP